MMARVRDRKVLSVEFGSNKIVIGKEGVEWCMMHEGVVDFGGHRRWFWNRQERRVNVFEIEREYAGEYNVFLPFSP